MHLFVFSVLFLGFVLFLPATSVHAYEESTSYKLKWSKKLPYVSRRLAYWSIDDENLYVVDDSRQIRIFSTKTGEILDDREYHPSVRGAGMAVHPNGRLIVREERSRREFSSFGVIDIQAHKFIRFVDGPVIKGAFLEKAWFSKSGEKLWVLQGNRSISLYETTNWTLIEQYFSEPGGSFSDGAISNDGKYFVVSFDARDISKLIVMDQETGKKLVSRSIPNVPIRHLRFSDNSKLLVYSANGGFLNYNRETDTSSLAHPRDLLRVLSAENWTNVASFSIPHWEKPVSTPIADIRGETIVFRLGNETVGKVDLKNPTHIQKLDMGMNFRLFGKAKHLFSSLVFSRNEKFLVGTTQNRVFLWEVGEE